MKLRYFFLLLAFLFPISSFAANDYSAVESEIFAFQKGFISQLKDTLQITSSGIMQTGDMRISSSFRIPYFGSGKVTLSLDRYSITLDQKTGDSEMEYRGRLAFDIRGTEQSYDYEKDIFTTVPREFSGHVDFSFLLTRVDRDAYMRLDSLDGSLSGDAETKVSFTLALEQAKKYIGKTYKIPGGDYISGIDPQEIQKSLYRGLTLLETHPLFRVVSENSDGTYRLRENLATVKKLSLRTSGIGKNTLIYSNLLGIQSLRISPKKNPKNNYLILSLTNDAYSLVGKIYERTRYSKTDVNFSLSRSSFTLKSREKDATLSIDWNNGKLILDMKSTGYSAHHFIMSGDLSLDMKNINLSLLWDEKKIGSIISKSLGNRVDYNMNFAFSDEMYDLLFDMMGSYTETLGNYMITPPSIYELLD